MPSLGASSAKRAKARSKAKGRHAETDAMMAQAATMEGANAIARREKEVVLRRERAAKNPLLFIWNYVRILDPDHGIIPFELWREQAECVRDFEQSRWVIILKARQLGITWLVLAYAVWKVLFRPGYTIVVVSKEEEAVKELMRRVRFILENLPRWMTRQKADTDPGWPGPVWDSLVMSVEILHPEGPSSRIVGEQQSKDSGRSFSASMVILDEWAFQELAEQIWTAAYPTINRPDGGQVIGLSTMEHGSFFQRMWDGAVAGLNGFKTIFLPWWVDKRRTPEWYERTKRQFPTSYLREYPASPEEAAMQGARQSFQFDKNIHVVDDRPPPEGWVIARAMDWGFSSKHAVLYAALGPEGQIEIFDELYDDHKTVPVVVERMKALEEFYRVDVRWSIADAQTWEQRGYDGPTVAEDFLGQGIWFDKSAKGDRQPGWQQIHERLAGRDPGGLPMLRVQRRCANLIKEFERAVTVDKGNDDVDKRKCSDHALDACRYLVVSRYPQPPKPKTTVPFWMRKGRQGSGSWMTWAFMALFFYPSLVNIVT